MSLWQTMTCFAGSVGCSLVRAYRPAASPLVISSSRASSGFQGSCVGRSLDSAICMCRPRSRSRATLRISSAVTGRTLSVRSSSFCFRPHVLRANDDGRPVVEVDAERRNSVAAMLNVAPETVLNSSCGHPGLCSAGADVVCVALDVFRGRARLALVSFRRAAGRVRRVGAVAAGFAPERVLAIRVCAPYRCG